MNIYKFQSGSIVVSPVSEDEAKLIGLTPATNEQAEAYYSSVVERMEEFDVESAKRVSEHFNKTIGKEKIDSIRVGAREKITAAIKVREGKIAGAKAKKIGAAKKALAKLGLTNDEFNDLFGIEISDQV